MPRLLPQRVLWPAFLSLLLFSLSAHAESTLTLKTQALRPNAAGELVFNVRLPKGFHLNKQAPQKWRAVVLGSGLKLQKSSAKNFSLPLRAKYSAAASGKGVVEINSTIYFCTDDMKSCQFKPVKVRVPFVIRHGGASTLSVKASVDVSNKV